MGGYTQERRVGGGWKLEEWRFVNSQYLTSTLDIIHHLKLGTFTTQTILTQYLYLKSVSHAGAEQLIYFSISDPAEKENVFSEISSYEMLRRN